MNPIDTLDALQSKLGATQPQPPADPYAYDSSFTKGLRSGTLAAGGQLNALAGAELAAYGPLSGPGPGA